MTLDQIKTFLWVSRLGGVRRAALEMNISQPAVSGRIAALEESLGTVLFDRAQRGVSLTKSGVLLRDYAEKIADLEEGIKADIVAPENVNSLMRIGVAETIVPLWLSKFLAELNAQYPKLRLEISVDLTVNLRQQLLERSLDFALLLGPISEYSVDNVELPPVELFWFTSTSNPNPDLGTIPSISYNRSSRPYRQLHRELSDRFGQDIRIYTSSSIHAGLEMVASGIGVGTFPKQLGAELVKQGRIVEFDPGWKLDSLTFTASYIGEPRNELYKKTAEIAQSVALNFHKNE